MKMWTVRAYYSPLDMDDTTEYLTGLFVTEADAERHARQLNARTGNRAFARTLALKAA
jgi:hypothetical protein